MTTKQKLISLWVLIMLTAVSACKTHEAAFKGEAWESDPSGFDEAAKAELTEFIKKNSRTTGLVAVYDGKVVYEYGDIKEISYIASCRKSVLSMLYGNPVRDGVVDLEATIGSMGVEEKDGLLPSEKEATVYDIITSRSGVFHVASNGGYDKDNFLERGTVKPGEYFVYNNWDFNVAGYLLEEATGNSVYEEMEKQLAIPLGFEDWNLENQKKYGKKGKSQYPAYHMYLSTRDMAKIGQLMLNNGKWEGKQIIPEDWVKESTTMVTPKETLFERWGPPSDDQPIMSYGYMWWLIESFNNNPLYEGGYTAIGYGGQWITVLPKAKLVIAHKTTLNLTTKIGITYNATNAPEYWEIVDRLVAQSSSQVVK